MRSLLCLFFLIGSLTSCGDNKPPGVLSDNGTFSYEYTLEGDVNCTTGKQEFPTRHAMCEALKNDALNRNCAEELRKGYFEKHCPEFTWE